MNIDIHFWHNSDNYEMCHKMKKSDICWKERQNHYMTNNQIDIAMSLFVMYISWCICVKMRFLDRVTYGESIGEKTNFLALLVR
jgi:hypothetical protein